MKNGDLIKFKNGCFLWTISRKEFNFPFNEIAIVIDNDYMDAFEYEISQCIIFYKNKFWIVQTMYTEAVKI